VLDNNLADITVAYEIGWNNHTEELYSKTVWLEAELIAPLVNDGTPFYAFRKLMLNCFDYLIDPYVYYRELYIITMSIPVFSSAT